jgi:sucrose-6-phosphate hydrolase SacC (GH32 family)
MKTTKLHLLLGMIGLISVRSTHAAYTEEYRPQYHFSPTSGWIGDPDGLIRYNNIYHLFWWGHAVSSDLVYWSQLPYPMNGGDGSFTYYSGSVAVDKQNTSGFGSLAKPPMVAVYTANNNSTGLQTQCLSYSTNAATFYYFSGNPVLNLSSTSFRDPDVFWDSQTSQWIMAVALSNQHIIQFYGSQNLIGWQYLSAFGPVGARDADWEDPGLFQLPVDGNLQNMKWVLSVNKGPNKIQYFVGNFDGTNFVMDGLTQSFLTNGMGLDGKVFDDFEGPNYGKWTVTGSAFGPGPAQGTFVNQMPVSGYVGHGLVNSYYGGDASTGTLTSPQFPITNRCISFLIGGGNNPGVTCMNLLVNGTVVQTATGNNSEVLQWANWNVTQWMGQSAQIQIVDNGTGSWGHIDVDEIMFSDVFADFEATDFGNWATTGTAFGSGPALGSANGNLHGYLGSKLAYSYNGGNAATGTLTSPSFTITRNCVNFLVGGGNNPGSTCINLLVNGSVVQTTTGNNDDTLRWAGWNVSQWVGQTAQIQIVDNGTGSWGHIDVDQIIFSDVLMNFNLEQANWVDWGSDFYAVRVYRDYDNVDPCAIWMGWMGNWLYANSVPESWGQGAESLPRNLGLVSSPRGCQLIQQPLSRFQKLRGPLVSIGPRTVQNTVGLAQFQPPANTYELNAVFNLSAANQNFGLNLCVGGSNKVVVGYDVATGNVFLDRRTSGNVSFSPSFPNIVTAPLSPQDGYVEFHIFVDQSSIEVFVNNGQAVLTSLIFPDPSSLGVQLFSANGVTTLRSLSAWNLSSIWH